MTAKRYRLDVENYDCSNNPWPTGLHSIVTGEALLGDSGTINGTLKKLVERTDWLYCKLNQLDVSLEAFLAGGGGGGGGGFFDPGA